MANAMSRLREEFSILGLSSLAFSDAPTGLRAFDITPPQAKAWAMFPWPFGPHTQAPG
jgi:hypothetical protein